MITGSKEADSPEKGEGNASNDGKFSRASSSSTTPWLRFKDPRIVRVSRTFGGKDRHSKVYTIRGLRDRRVRLSVPTAIQLYDLQDRLGLNQPSKVVDWLLNAAKQEIEDLPPLPIPSGNISLNHQAMFSSSSLEIDVSQSNEGGFKARTGLEDLGGLSRTNFWSTSSQALSGTKSKEVSRDPINMKEGWRKGSDHEDKDERNEGHNAMPYASLFHLETPSFPLGSHGFDAQTEDLHNISNALPLPSALSLSSGSQILVCPTPLPGTTHPYFPSHVASSSMEIDPRQINHFQMMTSSTQNFLPDSPAPSPYSLGQSMRPFHFSVTPRFLHSKQHSETHPDKEQELPSK